MLWNKCLDTELCYQCIAEKNRSEFEERCQRQDEAIIRHCLNTGRICPTERFHLDGIKERAQRELPDNAHRRKLLQRIRWIESEYDNDFDTDELSKEPVIFEITETSTFRLEHDECRICREEIANLISDDSMLLACTECAESWTEYSQKRITWLRLQDTKN